MKLSKIILLPIFSALMLGLSRTNLPVDMLSFVAFIPLLYYFELIEKDKHKLKKKTYFLHGLIFSTIYLLISIHWISLVTFPGFIGILFLFGSVFGLMFLLLSFMYKLKPILYPLAFIFTWLSFEFATNFTEFKFPWFSIAYGLDHSLSLIQILEFGGVPLLSFLILLVNYLFYLSLTRNKRLFIITFSLLIIWFIAGNLRLKQVRENSQQEDFTIALLQGSISQDMKWEDSMLDSTFTIYEKLSREVHHEYAPDLIIFPEAALPVYLLMWKEYYYRLLDLVMDLQTPVFTGFPHAIAEYKYKGQEEPFLYYNSANLFSPAAFKGETYFKNILVPFGERTPFLEIFPFLWKVQLGQANFEAGDSTVIYDVNGYTYAPLICFEIAFPLFLKNITQNNNPDFWVNLTNDAWFHRSLGTHQHAIMAVFRTIETRKAVFRAANTGLSFYTTPDGQMHQVTELFDRTYLTGNLWTYKQITPYMIYGFIFPYIFLIFFALQITNTIILLYMKKEVW